MNGQPGSPPADHVIADLDGLVALVHGETVNRAPLPGDS